MMNYSQEEIDVIAADSLGTLTYRQKRALLCAANPKHPRHIKYEQILIKSIGDGVYNKLKATFSSREYRLSVLHGLEEKGIECVTLKSGGYPPLLAEIPAPPLVLYCRGRTNLLKENCFSVVGSRRTPAATLAACRRISGELSSVFVIVTGVADGADTAAIEGALPSGNVVCVFPGGLNFVGSQSNAPLLKKVEKAGLIITEWPPETAVQKFMYAVRNRIIAGISRGVLVAAAPEKSGALITAGYAADFGRDVFAFPHSLGILAGEGSNELIKNGAYLCRNALDITGALGVEYRAEERSLTEEEGRVLDFLRQNGASHIQNIAAGVGIKVFQAVTLLSSLEIKGLAVRSGGNTYQPV